MLDLWLQPVDAVSIEWARRNATVLDDGETTRWRRYLSSESQTLFLVAHVATRHVLSQYAARDPGSWQFDSGSHGRPEIVDAPDGMRFNISHTEGMVAMLVHGVADCGVDVEYVRRPTDMRSVSRRVFTETEQAAIFSQPTESQPDRFFQLWTLKEAFIKATGKGFALPLQQFSFATQAVRGSSDQHIEFSCDPALATASEWQFFTHRTASDHVVSVAAQRQASAEEDQPVEIRRLNG